jgi:predicted NUDIX family phosphoesterase
MIQQPVFNAEHVLLCVSSHLLEIMGNNEITPLSRKLVTRFADPGCFWFGPRNLIENDTKFVQIVSYIIIEHDGKLLCYQRGHNSSEQRLKDKFSIGLGGHVSLTDTRVTHGTLDVMKTITAGAIREVGEELESYDVAARKKHFLLHSRLNAVDTVHCGLVELWNLKTPQVAIKDKSLNIIGFKTLSELAAMQGVETWSTLLIQHLKTHRRIQ